MKDDTLPQLGGVRHDYLRYANVWEDADVLLRGLRPQPGERCLCIASGGDNALMLLTANPALVVAVDINRPQLLLCALKVAAIKALSLPEYLAFAGFEPGAARRAVFVEKIAPHLAPEARAYWEQHWSVIEKGLVQAGKFERYFRVFARWVLPLIHSRKTVRQLFAPKSAQAQADFYHRRWNTWRWRALFRLFFSRFVMGRAGRDPAFLAQVQGPVAASIFRRAERHLCCAAAQRNPILRFNLTGAFADDARPDYLQPTHYQHIKDNLDRLHLHEGLAETAAERYGPFDCLALSDIFEYMDEPTFRQVGAALLRSARPGARFAYWNLLAPRNLAHLALEKLTYDETLSATLTAADRGFFYHQFIMNHYAADHA